MAGQNGFFGTIQGPFAADEEIFVKIQEQCKDKIDHLTKLGVHMPGDIDFDILGRVHDTHFITINGIDFQIGSRRMLELEDTNITSIKFKKDTDDRIYIDYQYKKLDEEENAAVPLPSIES